MTRAWRILCVTGLGLAAAVGAAASGGEALERPVAADAAERLRTAAREVLSTAEFARLHSAKESWWRAVWGWLRDCIGAIPDFLHGLPSWLFWLIFIWLVLALVALLAHMVWTLVQILRGSEARGGMDRVGSKPIEILGIRDLVFARVYEQAQGFLRAGNWPQAMRYLYVAAILWLDSVGAIAFHGSKTDQDYMRELARRPAQRAQFEELTRVFERCVYGVESPSEAACIRLAEAVKVLRDEAFAAQQN